MLIFSVRFSMKFPILFACYLIFIKSIPAFKFPLPPWLPTLPHSKMLLAAYEGNAICFKTSELFALMLNKFVHHPGPAAQYNLSHSAYFVSNRY